MHMSGDGANGSNTGDSTANKASESPQNGSESVSGTNTSDSAAGSDGENDAATADKNSSNTTNDSSAGDRNVSEDRNSTSSGKSHDDQNGGSDDSDSAQSDLPVAPIPSNPEGNSPVDQPSESDGSTPLFSGDDSYNASYLTTQDSNAPPGLLQATSAPPLGDGPYFIQSMYDPDYFLGATANNLEIFVNPNTGYSAMWSFARFVGQDYDYYTVKIGEYYLARAFTGLSGNQVTLASAVSDEAYWRLDYIEKDGEMVYVFFEPERQFYLQLDMNRNITPIAPEGVSCNDTRAWPYPVGSYPTRNNNLWIITLTSELQKNWTIVYEANDGEDSAPVYSDVLSSASTTIGTSDFKRPGYVITSWNTEADGTGESYEPGTQLTGSVLVNDYQMKLYAQWNPVFVDITYATGGNGSVEIVDSGDKQANIIQTISSSNGVIRDTTDRNIQGVTAVANKGYHFGSWTLGEGQGTMPEALSLLGTLTAEDVMGLSYYDDPETGAKLFHQLTLIAHFLSNTYTISFDANGGLGAIAPRTVTFGDTSVVTGANGLNRTRHVFKGWNTKSDGSGIFVNDAATLERLLADGVIGEADGSSAKLYAQWEETPSNVQNPSNQGGSTNNGTPGPTSPTSNGGGNGGSGVVNSGTGYYGGYRGAAFSSTSETPAVAETAELLEPKQVSSALITTQKADGGFFASPLGIGIIAVAGLILAAAVIAGAIAFVGGAGAGAAGAAGASQGGVFSRLRRVFGRG